MKLRVWGGRGRGSGGAFLKGEGLEVKNNGERKGNEQAGVNWMVVYTVMLIYIFPLSFALLSFEDRYRCT